MEKIKSNSSLLILYTVYILSLTCIPQLSSLIDCSIFYLYKVLKLNLPNLKPLQDKVFILAYGKTSAF